ncbi:MAG TPA: hypothetical protein PLM59_03435 [Oscillospiraceae bacterium]|nr:hypothetical protein [Oscillospiraceae bacterium]
MKKLLVGILCLTVMFSVSGCSEFKKGFEQGYKDAMSKESSRQKETAEITSTETTAQTTTDTPANVTTYDEGMYKIGSDMPAGEYVLITNSFGYFAITSDSTGDFSSILANDNFLNRSIITVKDGQYLTLERCTAYAFDDAPEVDLSSGEIADGMYKVGTDIPAGEYKISDDSSGMGYVEVSNSSSHDLSNIVSNDNFNGERYITVSEGQYLKLSRAKLKLN